MRYILFFITLSFVPLDLFADDGLNYDNAKRIASELSQDILSNNYEKLDKTLKNYIDNKLRTSTGDLAIVFILNLIFEENIESYQNKLIDMQAKYSHSFTSNLLLAKYYYDLSWHLRGDRFIEKTDMRAYNSYENILNKSLLYFKKLYALDSKSYLTNYYLFRLSKEINELEASSENYFMTSDSQVPNFLSLYLAKVDMLAPKWGGNEVELMSFANKHAWKKDNTSPLPFLIPTAYLNICNEYGGKKVLFKKQDVWEKIEKAYALLFARFPNAAYFKIMYAKALRVHGEKKKRLSYITEARKLDPDHPEVKKLLAKYDD